MKAIQALWAEIYSKLRWLLGNPLRILVSLFFVQLDAAIKRQGPANKVSASVASLMGKFYFHLKIVKSNLNTSI